MGRKSIALGEHSQMTATVFRALLAKRDISALSMRKTMTISNGRFYDLLNGTTPWYLEDLIAFSRAFDIAPATVMKKVDQMIQARQELAPIKDKVAKKAPSKVTALKGRAKPIEKSPPFSRMAADRQSTAIGMESDEGF